MWRSWPKVTGIENSGNLTRYIFYILRAPYYKEEIKELCFLALSLNFYEIYYEIVRNNRIKWRFFLTMSIYRHVALYRNLWRLNTFVSEMAYRTTFSSIFIYIVDVVMGKTKGTLICMSKMLTFILSGKNLFCELCSWVFGKNIR